MTTAPSARTGIEVRVSGAFIVVITTLLVACQRSQDEPVRTTTQGTATAATSASGQAPARQRPIKVYGSETTSITANPGERFVVALPGGTAVPYEWKLDGVPDVGILAMAEQGNTEAPPPGCAGCGGHGGAFTFTFDPKAAGTARLHFVYVRVAPPGSAPTRDVTIEVRVAVIANPSR